MISQIIIGVAFLGEKMRIAIPLTLVFCIVRFASNKNTDALQTISFFFATSYFLALGDITGVMDFSHLSPSYQFNLNLIPLKNESNILILLNIILFIPFGFVMNYLFNNNVRKAFFITVTVVLLIEISQPLFFNRLGDIDDIVANTMGGMLGFVLFKAASYYIVNIKEFNNRNLVASASLLLFSAVWSSEVKHICMGDIILMQFGINPWIGMDSHILSASGFHVTEVIGIIIVAIAFWIARKEANEANKRNVHIISIISISLVAYMSINIIMGFLRCWQTSSLLISL